MVETDRTPVADLFASDQVRAGTALSAVADYFRQMVESPGWQLFSEYVERLQALTAMNAFTKGNPHETLDYTSGYLQGLKDAIGSAETLASRAQVARKQEDEKDEETRESRRIHPALAGRGGV